MAIVVIEGAVEADLPGLLAIYNDVILHSTAVYTEAPETLAQRQSWWRQRRVVSQFK